MAAAWRGSGSLPISLRGVHPLLLEAFAAQTVADVCGKNAKANQQSLLGDLTTAQVAQALQSLPSNSYVEGLHESSLVLPEHPSSKTSATSHFRIDQDALTYQGLDTEDTSNGKAALASTLHALQAGVPEHAGPNSSHEMSHTVRSGPLSAPHSRGEGLATQPSIASGSTSGAAIGPGPRVFYVVHAWESKFGDVVKAVLQHYESLVWASVSASEGQEQSTYLFSLPHKLASWRVRHQLPVYYHMDVLSTNVRNPTAESWISQQCYKAMACSEAVLVAAVPSLESTTVSKPFHCLLEVLLTGLLQLPLQVIIPTASADLVSPAKCVEMLEAFDKSMLASLDLAKATTWTPADRDQWMQVINDWSADVTLGSSTGPRMGARSSAPGALGAAGAPGGPNWSTGLDVLLDVIRGRLKASVAEALFWGHLLTVFKLSQVVWSAREAAVAAARTLHSQQDQARADQYQQFVNREDASVRRGKIGLALTTAAAQGAQRSLPSAEAATVGGASNAALSKVFMKLSDHMDEKTAAFLKEARRGSPAVAQIQVRLTCKCESCATRLQALQAVNNGSKSAPSVYTQTPGATALASAMRSSTGGVKGPTGTRQACVQTVGNHTDPLGALAGFFPTPQRVPRAAACLRAEHLLRRVADAAGAAAGKPAAQSTFARDLAMLSQARMDSASGGPLGGSGGVGGALETFVGMAANKVVSQTGAGKPVSGPLASWQSGSANLVRASSKGFPPSRGTSSSGMGNDGLPIFNLDGTIADRPSASGIKPGSTTGFLPKLAAASHHRLKDVFLPTDAKRAVPGLGSTGSQTGATAGFVALPGAVPTSLEPEARTSFSGLGLMGARRVNPGNVLLVSVPMLEDHMPSSGGVSPVGAAGAMSTRKAGARLGSNARASAAGGPVRRFEDMLGDTGGGSGGGVSGSTLPPVR